VAEEAVERRFGDSSTPLLLSVCSGATVSMPGMLDRVLNLGLYDITAATPEQTFGERFAVVSIHTFYALNRSKGSH
jgi:pyruvate, orthophosphate dikinase